ncbi:MAG TPA: heavy metal translocating P-type ATPase [Candidatus Methylacidiphilales bacterium]|nr:heavy metal translocating P-type ATPase [Candidatus Methylacidiphilales bacterium]
MTTPREKAGDKDAHAGHDHSHDKAEAHDHEKHDHGHDKKPGHSHDGHGHDHSHGEGGLEDHNRKDAILTAATLAFTLGGLLFRDFSVPWYLMYLGAYAAGGLHGLEMGIRALMKGRIDVDMLMVLAAFGAAALGKPFEGGMLLFLFSVSHLLQNYAMQRTRSAIQSLMKLRPDEALKKLPGGGTQPTPVEEVAVGDVILLRPGSTVPLDGEIIEGESSLDQATLTGESMPVRKVVGDTVFAGTINQTGALDVRVTKLARDSTLSRMVSLVENARSEKAKTQRFLDVAEQYYACGVIAACIGLFLLGYVVWQEALGVAGYRAITLLVVASPCALVISTPASILSAIGGAARRGVLFKGGVHLERMAEITIIAFDKTGTLTEGKPRVTDIWMPVVPEIPAPNEAALTNARRIFLAQTAAIEAKSEHPLARAIVAEAKRLNLSVPEATEFYSTSGRGAAAKLDGRFYKVGSPSYFTEEGGALDAEAQRVITAYQEEGKTAVVMAKMAESPDSSPDKKGSLGMYGIIAIADTLRADAAESLSKIKHAGVRKVVMLTGDNKRVAGGIAKLVGVDAFHAELLPADKVRIIKELQAEGRTAMIGDGVNDAPALATAHIGIAMGGAGSDVAMETADVVLMSDQLQQVAYALALSRQAQRIVYQNLAFSMLVIVTLIAAALGLKLPLTLGVLVHEGSTVVVVLNGLRLLVYNPKL